MNRNEGLVNILIIVRVANSTAGHRTNKCQTTMHNLCPIYLLFLISDLQSLTDTEATEPKSKKNRNEMTKKKVSKAV